MSNIIHQSNNIVNTSGLKIVFLGTPDFALPTLEKLANSPYRPVAVFCAPDKPTGRRQILTPPPTKILAQKYHIPVYQPADKKELAAQIAKLQPDLILSAAYGIIVSKEVLETPKLGCLNIHPSLLPKYRGASPLQNAILNGDTKTGVTIFKMDEKMDRGPLVAKSEYRIANPKITTPELSEILASAGAELLLNILPDYLAGKIKEESQDEAVATYTKIIKKEDGRLDWQKSAKEIGQQIRAYTPWPGTYSQWLMTDGKWQIVKIQEASLAEQSGQKQIYSEQSRRVGEVFLMDADNLAVQTGNGVLIIKKLQAEGGKPLSASDFLRGHQDMLGKILN